MKKTLLKTICMAIAVMLCIGNLNAQERAKVEPKGNVLSHAIAKFPAAPVFRGELNEDVESHTAWTINSPGALQWKYYNKTDATYGFEGVDFPNSGEAMAFIVFKPSATTPPVNHPAHSGVQYFACFNSAQGPTNSWIVSQKFDVESNAKITFWGRALTTQYGPEVFKVCVSTTGDAQANFTTVISPGANVQVNTTSWTQYSYDIPNDAKYVAINCISNDAFALFIDDIKISGIGAHVPDPCPAITNLQAEIQGTDVKLTWTAATGTPTGYKVYDGVAVLGTVTTTEYVASKLSVGNHILGVEALYGDDCLPVKVTKTVEIKTGNPVKNLNGTCLEGVLTLTWTEPDTKGGKALYWITYSSDVINPESGIGLQDGGSIMAAARFTPEDLAANYVETGHKLTKLSFAMNTDGVTSPSLRVWTGGTSVTSPGTLAVNQPLDLSEINNGSWTTIDLTTPVNIDVTKELRVGYACTHPAGEFPILYDNGPHVPNKSDLLFAGSWTTLSAALGYSWNTCIKAGIEGEQVVPVVVRYDIYQDNVKIGETNTTTFTQNVSGTHNYCVVAVYDNDGQSPKVCKSIICTCAPASDLTVTYESDCSAATLAWKSPSATTKVNIYRDGTSIKTNVEGETYVDSDFEKDKGHTWSVRAICANGDEADPVNKQMGVCVGIVENVKTFSIVPNPATNNVTITAGNSFHTVEVLSFLGQVVLSQPNTGITAQMDISNLTNGVYFVRIISENGTSVQKFVKQ